MKQPRDYNKEREVYQWAHAQAEKNLSRNGVFRCSEDYDKMREYDEALSAETARLVNYAWSKIKEKEKVLIAEPNKKEWQNYYD